jgi:hypothetical protein
MVTVAGKQVTGSRSALRCTRGARWVTIHDLTSRRPHCDREAARQALFLDAGAGPV